jgi:hypothetical protein
MACKQWNNYFRFSVGLRKGLTRRLCRVCNSLPLFFLKELFPLPCYTCSPILPSFLPIFLLTWAMHLNTPQPPPPHTCTHTRLHCGVTPTQYIVIVPHQSCPMPPLWVVRGTKLKLPLLLLSRSSLVAPQLYPCISIMLSWFPEKKEKDMAIFILWLHVSCYNVLNKLLVNRSIIRTLVHIW